MRTSIDKPYLVSRMKDVAYFVLPDTTCTICNITMVNGFGVRGESACVDPRNFDQAVGREIAYENAFQKLWQLEGYLLAERMHGAARGDTNNYQAEQLKWHAALKCELLDILKISDPERIVIHVKDLLAERIAKSDTL